MLYKNLFQNGLATIAKQENKTELVSAKARWATRIKLTFLTGGTFATVQGEKKRGKMAHYEQLKEQ